MPSLPALRHHCPACGKAMSQQERFAGDHCSDWTCRHKRLEQQRKAEFAARLAKERDLAAESVGVPDAATAPVVVVRWYDTPLEPVPEAQRATFRSHLIALQPEVVMLAEAEAARAAAGSADEEVWSPPPLDADAQRRADEVDALLGQVCARCTGYCCRLGYSRQAFLDAPAMRRAQREHPGAVYEDLVQAYLDAIPALHHAGSCAFHGERGCVLPRERRAAICNSFECPGLELTRRHAEQDGVRRVYVVRHDAEHAPQGGFAPPG